MKKDNKLLERFAKIISTKFDTIKYSEETKKISRIIKDDTKKKISIKISKLDFKQMSLTRKEVSEIRNITKYNITEAIKLVNLNKKNII